MLDPDDPIVRTATFGRIVDDFLDGPIGSYLQERAQQEELEAVRELITVDAEDHRRIRILQMKAQIAGKITEWLADAIQAGTQALNTLQEEQSENGN